MMNDNAKNRRPIKTRSSSWAKKIASYLTNKNVSPNKISIFSVFFAAFGAALLLLYPDVMGLIGCAFCIQARLLCNLLDGMVAIEGGRKSVLGILYNELPDRISDCLLMIALGYSINRSWMGWLAALLSLLTAYIRVFGGSLGLEQDFRGPMAKSHRMAAMTAGCFLCAVEVGIFNTRYSLTLAAIVIVLGAAATCISRTMSIAKKLQESRLP